MKNKSPKTERWTPEQNTPDELTGITPEYAGQFQSVYKSVYKATELKAAASEQPWTLQAVWRPPESTGQFVQNRENKLLKPNRDITH